ncbi:hypothetical protein QRD89_00015 (plasmid) [Halobacillus sp. ACCC02827]|uniref:hypothetical protein n=1 Tax=Halobacillus sp. ACCC02827 TaxID=3052090 RepID=UPI00257025CD|nr:hypothetical protein [Halobacillus sp. ACCC02827]WJE14011.1 hypothetical protein QRD89_00015 [Halobacillus sp. ACCC02827]
MKKERNYKTTIMILSVLLIFMSGFSGFQFFQKYSKEEIENREELLTAVMWEITSGEDNISREDIEDITVLKAKAGVYPLNYDVAINMKNGDQILYSWKDENKSDVQRTN